MYCTPVGPRGAHLDALLEPPDVQHRHVAVREVVCGENKRGSSVAGSVGESERCGSGVWWDGVRL